jgi:nucleoside-diphosphate-sugar epimerase
MIVFGGGFVGGTIVASSGCKVSSIRREACDLTCQDAVIALASGFPTDTRWVIAAAVNPDRGVPHLDGMTANIAIARNLAALAAHVRPSHVTFLSSIDVYGREDAVLPIDEDTQLRPCSYYAISKITSELVLARACRELDIPLAILRLPGVYGPGDTHSGPVSAFTRAALNNAPVTVSGTGEQQRDLLYVADLPPLIATLSEERIAGAFNAVTGKAISLNRILEVIQAAAKKNLDISYTGTTGECDLVFSPSRIHDVIPDFAFTPMEVGIRATWDALVAAKASSYSK